MSHEIILSIVTIPDVEALRRIHQLGKLSDEGVLSASMHLHNQQFGSRTLPLYQQKIVSIATVKSSGTSDVSLLCLEQSAKGEVDLLGKLDELTGAHSTLVAWDMSAYSSPLLNYRLLKHSLVAQNVNEAAVVDLHTALSNDEACAEADLAGLAHSLSLPAIPEISQQWAIDCYLAQQLDNINTANQIRALNSYLIYLRYQLIQAKLSTEEYQSTCESLRQALIASDIAALKQFETDWIVT